MAASPVNTNIPDVVGLTTALAAKGRKAWENVRDYGAVGNGSANDTAAIAAAVTAAKATGGSRWVYFPPGTYLTDKITGVTQDMIVSGAGPQSIVKSRLGDHVFEITSPNDCINTHFRDLQIQGSGNNAVPSNTGCGIYVHDTTIAPNNNDWSNLFIQFCGGHGICLGTRGVDPRPNGLGDLNTMWSSTLRRIRIQSCGDHHLRISNCGPSFSITDYAFFYSPATGSYTPDGRGYGLVIYAGHCHLRCINGDSLGTAVGGHTYIGEVGSNVILDSCQIENWPGVGLYLDSCSAVVQNCVFSTWSAGGSFTPSIPIRIAGFNAGAQVLVNNHFDSSNSSPLHGELVHVEGIASPIVIGNAPLTAWNESLSASRTLARLTPGDVTGGQGFNIGDTAGSANSTAKRDANGALTSSQFIGSGQFTGGFQISDSNWGFARDDSGIYTNAQSLVVRGFGSGSGTSTREFVVYDMGSFTKRLRMPLGETQGSSGTAYSFQINPTINQSSTAGYTALQVNATESATGSGNKSLLDLQVGGTSKFRIDNTGAVVTNGGILRGFVASDLTSAVATAADITGLNFAVGASQTWDFRAVVRVGSTSGTIGCKFAVTFPASATIMAGVVGGRTTTTGVGEALVASGTLTTVFFGAISGGTPSAVLINGTVTTGASAGTVQFQFASATAGTTVTVYANSDVVARRIA
jgi:hypothetical protein